jgi:peptide/nickel transport system substrate-binding protein
MQPSKAEAAGTLRVGLLADLNNYDPMQFSAINFFLIKNLYDSVIDYDDKGNPLPALATSWDIAPDNKSVTLHLRDDVKFQSGNPMDAASVAATLAKAADPQKGKNAYATMAIVKDWTVVDPTTITINMHNPVPDRQILDLLQFLAPIDPAGIENVAEKPAGTGPFMLADRVVGQSVTLKKNPNYWRPDEPKVDEIVFTIFSDSGAASAALESGSIDLMYSGTSRDAVRLRDAGFQVFQGPGKLVQVFRINTTRPPFNNEKFRQAFNYLMNREAILKAGYAGLGVVTALPWAPVSPAWDDSYTAKYAYDPAKGKAMIDESGLSDAEKSNWKLLTNGGDQETVLISQIVQATLKEIGINIELDVKQGAEMTDAMLGGDFAATFGGIGNVQKFPSRVATNSIYRTKNNPVLGEPHPFPAYVDAIAKVDNAFGEDVQKAYDNLNKVLIDSSFAIPTNSYEIGLIVAAPNVSGITLDIDNLLVGRTIEVK